LQLIAHATVERVGGRVSRKIAETLKPKLWTPLTERGRRSRHENEIDIGAPPRLKSERHIEHRLKTAMSRDTGVDAEQRLRGVTEVATRERLGTEQGTAARVEFFAEGL
jgi:hypothetical protein